jgi:hypothetical protein
MEEREQQVERPLFVRTLLSELENWDAEMFAPPWECELGERVLGIASPYACKLFSLSRHLGGKRSGRKWSSAIRRTVNPTTRHTRIWTNCGPRKEFAWESFLRAAPKNFTRGANRSESAVGGK